MPRLMQWPLLLAVALLVCLVNLGCGSGGHPAAGSAADGGSATGSGSAPGGSVAAGGGNAPGAPGSNGSDGAPGAPGTNGQDNGGGGPTAPASPITIPDVIHLWGHSVAEAMNALVNGVPLNGENNAYIGLLAQCPDRHTLCVNLKTKVDTTHSGLTLCQASGVTDPPLNSVVYPGDTIWVGTGDRPCASYQTPYPPSPSPSGGQSSTSPSGGQSSTSPSGGQSSTSPSGGQSSTSSGGGQSPVDASSP
jgi:hypothetical protein